MSSRIDIELTSVRDDGSWTWRAAGARQPRGLIGPDVLYEGAKVGDVVRAEADFEIDGITVRSVMAPKQKRQEPERLQLLDRKHDAPAGVTTSLVGKSDRRNRREQDGFAKPERGPRRRPSDAKGQATDLDRGRPVGRERPRPGDADRGETDQKRRTRRQEPAASGRGTSESEARARPKRLSPGTAHRSALMANLSPEQVPVAEQLMKGGLPAVRQAVAEQNQKARAGQAPSVNADALLAMADVLLPRVRAASWRDRAEAAAKMIDDLTLRDLRSVVVGSDAAARDDQSRALASTLREAFEGRVAKLRQDWTDSIEKALEEGRVDRALELAGRSPEPTARISADMAAKLRDAAGAALSEDTPPQRWLKLLEAVA